MKPREMKFHEVGVKKELQQKIKPTTFKYSSPDKNINSVKSKPKITKKDNGKIKFGPYKGKKYENIPRSYLEELLKTNIDKTTKNNINRVLAKWDTQCRKKDNINYRSRAAWKKFKEKGNTYYDYLKTEHWINFRKSIINYRKYCEQCGTDKNLQVHHLHYHTIFNERPKDVKLLCQKCHSEEHGIEGE